MVGDQKKVVNDFNPSSVMKAKYPASVRRTWRLFALPPHHVLLSLPHPFSRPSKQFRRCHPFETVLLASSISSFHATFAFVRSTEKTSCSMLSSRSFFLRVPLDMGTRQLALTTVSSVCATFTITLAGIVLQRHRFRDWTMLRKKQASRLDVHAGVGKSKTFQPGPRAGSGSVR